MYFRIPSAKHRRIERRTYRFRGILESEWGNPVGSVRVGGWRERREKRKKAGIFFPAF